MPNNETVKRHAWKLRVPQWKIANEIGVSEITITRWLRQELTEERFRRLMAAVDKIAEAEGDVEDG